MVTGIDCWRRKNRPSRSVSEDVLPHKQQPPRKDMFRGLSRHKPLSLQT